MANRAPSIIQYEVTIKGKSAHAGFEPEKGISAIVAASKIISKLNLGRINSNTTANVGTITGGTGVNIVPESVTIKGEVRSFDKDEAWSIVKPIDGQSIAKGRGTGALHMLYMRQYII